MYICDLLKEKKISFIRYVDIERDCCLLLTQCYTSIYSNNNNYENRKKVDILCSQIFPSLFYKI